MNAMKRLLAITLFTSFLVLGCKKDNTPVAGNYYFNYKVRISDKIEEPTIINGYYGKVRKYEGDFMPSPDTEAREPEVAKNIILFFEARFQEEIEETVFTKDGTQFYNLKAIEKKGIQPKVIIFPNDDGFYQIDTNANEYVALIRINAKRGYFNGGLQKFGGLNNELKEQEMRIDYNATF